MGGEQGAELWFCLQLVAQMILLEADLQQAASVAEARLPACAFRCVGGLRPRQEPTQRERHCCQLLLPCGGKVAKLCGNVAVAWLAGRAQEDCGALKVFGRI